MTRGKHFGSVWAMVESGPPVIWIPRAGLTRFITNYGTSFNGLSFGLGWWIVTVGWERRLSEPRSPQKED